MDSQMKLLLHKFKAGKKKKNTDRVKKFNFELVRIEDVKRS